MDRNVDTEGACFVDAAKSTGNRYALTGIWFHVWLNYAELDELEEKNRHRTNIDKKLQDSYQGIALASGRALINRMDSEFLTIDELCSSVLIDCDRPGRLFAIWRLKVQIADIKARSAAPESAPPAGPTQPPKK